VPSSPIPSLSSSRSSVQFVQIVGGEEHSCALQSEDAYCWGTTIRTNSATGRQWALTNAGRAIDTVECQTAPIRVAGSGIPPLTSLSSGPLASHTCSLAGGGVGYCWGYNYNGQLGDGTTANQPAPVQVVGSGTAPLVFTELSAGGGNTCGATTDYAAYVGVWVRSDPQVADRVRPRSRLYR